LHRARLLDARDHGHGGWFGFDVGDWSRGVDRGWRHVMFDGRLRNHRCDRNRLRLRRRLHCWLWFRRWLGLGGRGTLNDQLDGDFIAHALGFRGQWKRKRCRLNCFGYRALLAQLSATLSGEDLFGESFDRVDRQNRRRHIMATVSR
jgi:hypothetical protein